MTGFETKSNEGNSVSGWTKEQCEEYLEKFPKGLWSEQARVRLNQLDEEIKKTRERMMESKKNMVNTSTGNITGGGLAKTNADNQWETIKDFVKFILVLAVLAFLVFIIYSWITEGLASWKTGVVTILGGLMFIKWLFD